MGGARTQTRYKVNRRHRRPYPPRATRYGDPLIMIDRPKLLGISGSLRAGSFSTAVVEGLRVALAPRADLTVFRLNDVPLYNGDLDTATPPDGVAALRAAIAGLAGASA